jgi:hypothetical protein
MAIAGHTVAVPPITLMNSRRRMSCPKLGDGILSALAGTFIEAEIGIKANAAAHSRCPRWVKLGPFGIYASRLHSPEKRTSRDAVTKSVWCQTQTSRLSLKLDASFQIPINLLGLIRYRAARRQLGG